MREITGARKLRIVNAIKKARALRDRCEGSVYSNLVKLLGRDEADLAMTNLMWQDPGFAPPKGTRG